MHRAEGARAVAQQLIEAALAAVEPTEAVRRALDLQGDRLSIDPDGSIDLASVERVLVIGGGKAGAAMACGLEQRLGDRIDGGCVIVPADALAELPQPQRIELRGGSHPLPSRRSVDAARALTALLDDTTDRDLVIALISGGASALLALPAGELTVEQLAEINRLMLQAGMAIDEMNVVRRHLSRIKGGGLARLAAPARVLSLIISDVVGSPLEAIASGPTSADASTYDQALALLDRYRLLDGCPAGVRSHLEAGVRGEHPETLAAGAPELARVTQRIIASCTEAAEAAQACARDLGFDTLVLSTCIQGEAREVGRVLAAVLREIAERGRPVARPACVVCAGETTVTVRGRGRGGRNQELALAAALDLDGLDGVLLVALGTDGIDGPTDAAGAMVDGNTVQRARRAGLDPRARLAANDAYSLLAASGDLIRTGATGTNVNDLTLLLAPADEHDASTTRS